ncbi:MAG: GntR family transcriptional regulator [Boseongicola sp.]|nr:GntR family transcriptional regulator [Boseongicola sp.]
MNERVAPKYMVVHDEILKRLKSNQYSVGTRLPSEESLAGTFKVSRVTIRKSLEMLVDAGYLASRQGSGYHVNCLSPQQETCLASFTDAVLRKGRVPGAKLIGIDVPHPDPPEDVTEVFDVPVARIHRLRTVDGEPEMLVSTWVPTSLVTGLAPDAFPEFGPDQSILRILSDRFNLAWTRASETVHPCAASFDVAEHLGIESGTPILSVACTAYDDTDLPVFHDQVFRATPIVFNLSGSARKTDPI